jgi:GT2 family glycosyltransferase
MLAPTSGGIAVLLALMTPPDRPFPPDVDVAVVSHNGRQTLPRVLSCLVVSGAPTDRIVVYDIASTDGTATWLGSDWPGLKVVSLDTNEGPNPARNRAIGDATRPYLLLVDSDAYLRPDVPQLLADHIRTTPGVGATVPVVVHAERPDVLQYAGSRLHYICEAINPWGDRPLSERGVQPTDTGTAPGVCFLLDVAVARRIGMFDGRYFMGKEDGEFCYRLRLAGHRLTEVPLAVAEHGSKPRSTWLFPYQVRNRWHFMLKNYATGTLLVLAPALLLHELVQLAMLVAKGQGGAWWRAARMIGPMCATLGADRRFVATIRRVRDGDLLDAAPLVVRDDLVGGGLARLVKRGYDGWLIAYWRLARAGLR